MIDNGKGIDQTQHEVSPNDEISNSTRGEYNT